MNDNKQPVEILDNDFPELVDELSEPLLEILHKHDMIAILKDTLQKIKPLEKNHPELEFSITGITNLIKIMTAEDLKDYDFITESSEFEEFCKELSNLPRLRKIIETNQKQLSTLQSILPARHTMPIHKLASELQHDLINNGAIDLIVAGKGKKNEVTSYVLATYEQPEAITMTGKPYTEFDRQVQDAVSSLWEYGHESHIVTPDMVARAMTHKTQTEKVSPQFKGAVTKSLEKMWAIRIEIDASEEIKKRKISQDGKPVDNLVYNGNLLALEKIEVGAGGKTVKGYHILREPILLSYAKMTNQLATVDARLLDIKEVDEKGKVTTVSIKSNEARVAINGYLLRRIAVMKNDRRTNKKPKQSNIILFDTLFEETGIPQDSHARRIKYYAFQVLDYFTAMDYIKGYTKRKNRKSFDAVIIDL